MRDKVLVIDDGMRQYQKLVMIITQLLSNDGFNVGPEISQSSNEPEHPEDCIRDRDYDKTLEISKGENTIKIYFFRYKNCNHENNSVYMIEVDSDDESFFNEVNTTIQKVKNYDDKPLPKSDGGVWDEINMMIGDYNGLHMGGRSKRSRRSKKTRRLKKTRRARKTRRT